MRPLLILGTRNRKKCAEIVEILGDLELDLRDLTSWPETPEVVEDGATFEANARKKASAVAAFLRRWVIGRGASSARSRSLFASSQEALRRLQRSLSFSL